MKKNTIIIITIILLSILAGCKNTSCDCPPCEVSQGCDECPDCDFDTINDIDHDEEGDDDLSGYMLLKSEDTIYIYNIGESEYPEQIDITGSKKQEVIGNRILIHSDYLDIYDFTAKKLNDDNYINIENLNVKTHKQRFYVFDPDSGVSILDLNGNYIESLDEYEWIKAAVVGQHIFIVYSHDIYTYDLDGSNKTRLHLFGENVELLENKIINISDTGGIIYTWTGEDWEDNYFESPYSDNLVWMGNWIIGISDSELRFFDLDGEPIGSEHYLFSEFKKENVIFP